MTPPSTGCHHVTPLVLELLIFLALPLEFCSISVCHHAQIQCSFGADLSGGPKVYSFLCAPGRVHGLSSQWGRVLVSLSSFLPINHSTLIRTCRSVQIFLEVEAIVGYRNIAWQILKLRLHGVLLYVGVPEYLTEV